ncbi:hypothetical protein BB559_000065 [Furculomyces boomerangus]|uniref:Uncharacterized protein n=2 Tax=Harpellales TaxID=61421 RepID=A0A2T9Z6F0_9FUNG|nr:hypothetical protein BB559_000065 [Furculomyces boomerangus]PVZ98949.1 hypothetical protein BB558_005040 [Smittium angustum]
MANGETASTRIVLFFVSLKNFRWILAFNIILIVTSLLLIFIILSLQNTIIATYSMPRSIINNPKLAKSHLNILDPPTPKLPFFKRLYLLLTFNPGNSSKVNPVVVSIYFVTAIFDLLYSILRIVNSCSYDLSHKHDYQFSLSANRCIILTILMRFFFISSLFSRALFIVQIQLIVINNIRNVASYIHKISIFLTIFSMLPPLAPIIYNSVKKKPSSLNSSCGMISRNIFFSSFDSNTIAEKVLEIKQAYLWNYYDLFIWVWLVAIYTVVASTIIVCSLLKNRNAILKIKKSMHYTVVDPNDSSDFWRSFRNITRRSIHYPLLISAITILMVNWSRLLRNYSLNILETIKSSNVSDFAAVVNSNENVYGKIINLMSFPQSGSNTLENQSDVSSLISIIVPPKMTYFHLAMQIAFSVPGILIFFSFFLEKPIMFALRAYFFSKFNRVKDERLSTEIDKDTVIQDISDLSPSSSTTIRADQVRKAINVNPEYIFGDSPLETDIFSRRITPLTLPPKTKYKKNQSRFSENRIEYSTELYSFHENEGKSDQRTSTAFTIESSINNSSIYFLGNSNEHINPPSSLPSIQQQQSSTSNENYY